MNINNFVSRLESFKLNSDLRKYLAEGLGTFALTFVVSLSLVAKFPIATPLLAAICLGLFVYSVGHISGTHINPAVTIGLWSIRKISSKDALWYLFSQFIGAELSAVVVLYTIGLPQLEVTNSFIVLLAEVLGTMFFTFGIASVVNKKAPDIFSGVVVGGSLLFGIAIAAMLGSNGVLNPAVALGIKSFGIMYILGPIIGSVLGMWIYKYISE